MGKKEKIQIIVTALLLVILVALITLTFRKEKSAMKKQEDREKIGQEKIELWKKNIQYGIYSRLQNETQELTIKRDPFQEVSLDRISGPILSGIFWKDDKPYAVINGEILGVGQSIAGYTVKEIQNDRVIVNDGSENLELLLQY